jgi:very-short-patch-repair endonuclease
MKKLTKEEFLKRAKEIHGEKYDYSKTDLNNRDEKGRVIITCPIHGDFKQTPYHHLCRKQGCKSCKFNNWNTKTIIEAFAKKYGDKYDYSKVEYKGYHTNVYIICPKHGEFKVTPANFLLGKQCPKCKVEKLREFFSLTTDEFIQKAKEIHGDKYDYSKVEYVNNNTDICVICPIHGEVWQTPANHLKNSGCRYCSCEKTHLAQKKTTEQFIKEARAIHGDKYDYSKVDYKGNKKDVIIICPIHGEFKQSPVSHLNGRGCKLCNESHLEKEVTKKLDLNGIIHNREKKFKWLGGKSIDFYLPQHNIAIECQGKQHFSPMIFFDKNDSFKNRVERDVCKKQLCEEHGVKLYYFSHENFDEFLGEKVYHNIDELIEKITNNS